MSKIIKNVFIFILLSFFITLLAFHKGIFLADWWINFDMDLIISSNSLSLYERNYQSYFDHPGLTNFIFFSLFLKASEYFNYLPFDLNSFYTKEFYLENIKNLIIQLRIFNIISIIFLVFTFFKLFELFLKKKILALFLSLALLTNLNFLSFNFFPVRTEVLSIFFLNLTFLIILNYRKYKIALFLAGVFIVLSMLSKLQIIYVIFVYILIFLKRHLFFSIKNFFSKINFNFFLLNSITFFISFYFYQNILDSLVIFLLFSFFNIFFYFLFTLDEINISEIYFFYLGVFSIFFAVYLQYDIKNLEIVLNPLYNSLKWSQPGTYLINFDEFDLINFLRNYRNFITIFSLILFFLLFGNGQIEFKQNIAVTFIAITLLFILFSLRSGFLRYGIYIMPCLYLLFAKLLKFEKRKTVFFIISYLLFINLTLNFSFLTYKHDKIKDLRNLDRISRMCNISDAKKRFNELNYFFSVERNKLKIICDNIKLIN